MILTSSDYNVFPVLISEILKRGIAKTVMARAIKVSYRSMLNKLSGVSPFTIDEALIIQERFFPDMDLRTLFRRA